MIQKDYIERMATQIAKMIAELLGYDTSERLEHIDEIFHSMLDGELETLENLDGAELINFLSESKSLQITEIELLANLLHLKGNTLVENEMEGFARKYWLKSLDLLNFVDQEMDIFSMERRGVFADLKSKT